MGKLPICSFSAVQYIGHYDMEGTICDSLFPLFARKFMEKWDSQYSS